jgi:hypothetical protein
VSEYRITYVVYLVLLFSILDFSGEWGGDCEEVEPFRLEEQMIRCECLIMALHSY